MSRAVYRWIDALGNENIQTVNEFDQEVHRRILNTIIEHRDTHYMSNRDLKLVITVNDKYWSSFNMLTDYDVVYVWRAHKN